MRICIAVLLALSFIAPASALAAGSASSSVRLSHPVLAAGQVQGITVVARDLEGNPLAGAAVFASVRYGSRSVNVRMPVTDRSGKSYATFKPPAGISVSRATVNVTITNGYLSDSLSASFTLSLKGSTGNHPTGTPQPGQKLQVVARVLPAFVVAPQPVWIVVSVRTPAGSDLKSAPVTVAAVFKSGKVAASTKTDTYGVATIRIDTSPATTTQTVTVGVVAHWNLLVTTSSARFTVQRTSAPKPTATPTATSKPAVTSTATLFAAPTPTSSLPGGLLAPTGTPTPTATEVPTAMATATPTSTPEPTSQPTPTATPVPSATPTPTPTVTPTSTPTPTATATPTDTPTPTDTSTPVPTCPGSDAGCMQAELNLINQSRADHGLQPYALNMAQSQGTGTCIGSLGHSKHMAQTNTLAHDQFPADICGGPSPWGENIGKWDSGNELTDLQNIHSLMMSEPYSPGCQGSHICNILSTEFHQVGIGVYSSNGTTWLTTDFMG